MRFRVVCGVVLVLMLAVALPGNAQQSAEQLFQSGLYKEEVEGDLRGAVQIYENILKDFPDNRSVAAKALLQMGLCYEKLGVAGAQNVYRRLVQEFGDQPGVVQIARDRLQQLDAGLPGDQVAGPTYRLVLDDETPEMDWFISQFDFSPNGDRVVFRGRGEDSGKLYIADETGTLIRPLLDDWGAWNGASCPRWSPDGQLIAYCAWREMVSDSGVSREYALFVANPDGGATLRIEPALDKAGIRSLCWTPDSHRLTYVVEGDTQNVRTIALDGTGIDAIHVKSHRSVWLGSFSPDGRWLAFQALDESTTDTREMDIWLLPAAGGQPVRLTQSRGFDAHPTWAGDGSGVYFVSSRSRDWNIWRISLNLETGLQKGEPQQVTFFSDARLMFPKVLGDGGRIAFAMRKTSSSIHVADASRPDESRVLIRGGAPQLSPDGQTVYYVGQVPGKEGIFAAASEGGTPRRLTQHRPVSGFDLSPRGHTLAYFADLNGERGLFLLPTNGGEPKLLLKIDTKELVVPRWSPDGSQLAYAYDEGLYVIPASGSEPRKLAPMPELEAHTVRWSPDGRLLAALGYTTPEAENNAVFVTSASGGEPRQLTPDNVYKEGLEWHPDGQRLTYHASLGKSETRQAYLDGRPPGLLLDHPGPFWDYTGVWAPDGRRFFFFSSDLERKDRSGVYIYDEATGDITLFARNSGLPRWSRDGKTITWTTGKQLLQLWLAENILMKAGTAR